MSAVKVSNPFSMIADHQRIDAVEVEKIMFEYHTEKYYFNFFLH
jgi:hypothetical protein